MIYLFCLMLLLSPQDDPVPLPLPPPTNPWMDHAPAVSANPAGAGQALQFSCAASDPHGAALAYRWDFGDGSSSTLQRPTHAFAQPGLYLIDVTADNGRASCKMTLMLRVGTVMEGLQVPRSIRQRIGHAFREFFRRMAR